LEEVKRIVITGPESTGKTNIANHLATKFNSVWIPEYARFYIENLKTKYDYSDIEKIARKQVEDYHHYSRNTSGMVIFDTWLIITKVWFQKVYKKYPQWLEESIQNLKIDLYLLCTPDIEWKPDPLRENPGKMREILFNAYESEIKKTGVPFGIINGSGRSRFETAEKLVTQNLKI
jgi:NadR type nicotinamide-nucleotide adenylyltransferase